MITKKDKQENEVYILGSDSAEKQQQVKSKKKGLILLVGFLAILIGMAVFYFSKEQTPEYYFEPEESTQQSISIIEDSTDSLEQKGFIEVLEETVNDVPLIVYVPHRATLSLALDIPDKLDSTIVFAAMAADIRKDNKQIVGDFVLAGNRLSRGVAKKGFCAIVHNTISIGMGEDTPLLQQAIENNGFFFRQYPLVYNNELIENKPKNKSIRRALAVRSERVVMIESKTTESFHDFSQALLDIGVSDAIYLVGGNAYGWYYNKEQILQEFGIKQPDTPDNVSYIIWRIK